MVENKTGIQPFRSTIVALLLICLQISNVGCNKQQTPHIGQGSARIQQGKGSDVDTVEQVSKSREEKTGVNVFEMTDLIDWKVPIPENFIKSTNEDKWVLVDVEQFGIFQVARGIHDYRFSKRVKDELAKLEVDCYYLLPEDGEEVFSLVGEMLEQANLTEIGNGFAILVNFHKEKLFSIELGTESELLAKLTDISQMTNQNN